MEPMGTGRLKEILSSERNRMGPRVNNEELVYPSCGVYEGQLLCSTEVVRPSNVYGLRMRGALGTRRKFSDGRCMRQNKPEIHG